MCCGPRQPKISEGAQERIDKIAEFIDKKLEKSAKRRSSSSKRDTNLDG